MIYCRNKQGYAIKEGFTLIELVVVIMILGILAATVGPAAYRYLVSGRDASAKTSIRAFAQAIDSFQAEIGAYPKELEDLIRKPATGTASKKWTSPYLKGSSIPEDPWGNPYVYKVTPGAEHPYELYSYGPNGEGAPEEEHINVWKL